MSAPRPQAVGLTIMDSARPPTSATVSVQDLDASARAKRAAVRWLGCWLAMPVVFFIPLLHLLAPLALFILGPVLGISAWRVKVLLVEGPVACPKCTETTPVPQDTPGWPARLHCEKCGSTFFATPA